MATGLYNNPMVGQSLSNLVNSFVGKPTDVARAELAASEALLNNQTAQFRTALHGSGMGGDLSKMMIHALAAGPDYSRYADAAGMSALKFGASGYGSSPYDAGSASSALANMMSMAVRGGGGGRGRRSGGGGSSSSGISDTETAGYDWNALPVTGRNSALSMARRAMDDGLIPEGVTETMLAATLAQNPGGWANPQEAVAALNSPDAWHQPMTTQEVVTNPGGTMLSRLFVTPSEPDAVEMQEVPGDWQYRQPAGSTASQGIGSAGKAAPPKPGDIVGGMQFKGGNPKDKSNWVAIE